jgi:hypothetical protein
MKPKHWRVTETGTLEPSHAPGHHITAPTKAAAAALLLQYAARCIDRPPAVRHRAGAYQLDYETLTERTAVSGRTEQRCGCTMEAASGYPSRDSSAFLYLSGPDYAAACEPTTPAAP